LVELLDHIGHEQCFNQLRTIEQLGYVVGSGGQFHGGMSYYAIMVQSSERSAHYLYHRIENYLQLLRKHLAEISDDEFGKHKSALILVKEEKDKTLVQETNRLWNEIASHRYAWNRALDEVEELQRITKEQILAFFDRSLSLPFRSVLVVEMYGNQFPIPSPNEHQLLPSLPLNSQPQPSTQANEEVKQKDGEIEEKKSEGGEKENIPPPLSWCETPQLRELRKKEKVVFIDDPIFFKRSCSLTPVLSL